MLNFVIAGRDTTANLLSWCFYEIAQRKEVEDNLIEEVDFILFFSFFLSFFHHNNNLNLFSKKTNKRLTVFLEEKIQIMKLKE